MCQKINCVVLAVLSSNVRVKPCGWLRVVDEATVGSACCFYTLLPYITCSQMNDKIMITTNVVGWIVCSERLDKWKVEREERGKERGDRERERRHREREG